MLGLSSLMLLLAPAAALRLGASPQTPRAAVRLCDEAPTEAAPEAAPAPPAAPARYDVSKLTGDPTDIGKSTLDPVLSTSAFLSRRFGLAGGVALVALLAAVEGKEILASLFAPEAETVVGETVTTPSGLQYVDLVKGRVGDSPKPGEVVGFKAKVTIGDKLLFDTANDKPVAFKLGSRPFQNIVCLGVEEGLRGMKVGSKRRLTIPKELAPPGLELPPGVPIVYEIEVTEVLPSYF